MQPITKQAFPEGCVSVSYTTSGAWSYMHLEVNQSNFKVTFQREFGLIPIKFIRVDQKTGQIALFSIYPAVDYYFNEGDTFTLNIEEIINLGSIDFVTTSGEQ